MPIKIDGVGKKMYVSIHKITVINDLFQKKLYVYKL